ncbi:MAG: DNA-binding protein [bacterium]
MDIEIHREELPVERKRFAFSLRQNPRGRFLRITEEAGEHRDTIIMPSTGLQQFKIAIDNLIEADKTAGPVVPPPAPAAE